MSKQSMLESKIPKWAGFPKFAELVRRTREKLRFRAVAPFLLLTECFH
jgi:hypothetical protein